MELFYKKYGTGDPIILLHGLGSSHKDWEEQIPLLEQFFTVYTVDLRGHGQSGKPPGPYSMEGFAEDVVGFMARQGIQEAHLVGISMGGMVALQLAVDYPDMVKSLAIINSTAEVLLSSRKQKYLVYTRLGIFHLLGISVLGEIGSRKLFPKREQAETRRRLARRFKKNKKAPYLASLKAIIGWSVKEQLSDLTVPVLVISGDQDYTTPEEKQEWVQLIPDHKFVVIPNSRHVSNYDQPEIVNRALAEFLLDKGSIQTA